MISGKELKRSRRSLIQVDYILREVTIWYNLRNEGKRDRRRIHANVTKSSLARLARWFNVSQSEQKDKLGKHAYERSAVETIRFGRNGYFVWLNQKWSAYYND